MDNQTELSLLDTIDHLLDRGVVISGDAVISIAGIDLVYLGLNITLASVDTLRRVDEARVEKQRTIADKS